MLERFTRGQFLALAAATSALVFALSWTSWHLWLDHADHHLMRVQMDQVIQYINSRAQGQLPPAEAPPKPAAAPEQEKK